MMINHRRTIGIDSFSFKTSATSLCDDDPIMPVTILMSTMVRLIRLSIKKDTCAAY